MSNFTALAPILANLPSERRLLLDRYTREPSQSWRRKKQCSLNQVYLSLLPNLIMTCLSFVDACEENLQSTTVPA